MTEFGAARTKMVDSQLRTEGVTDHGVLEAMGEVPRERFVSARFRGLAYIDEDIPVRDVVAGAGPRYLMEPAPFARLLQAAEIAPTDKALVIGVATGYAAAVVGRLAASVIALESDAALAALANANLSEIGGMATVITGPLELGFKDNAPFDVIVFDGSVEAVPQAVLDQLAEGGRLVAVVGYGRSAPAMLFVRTDGDIGSRPVFNAGVRPLPGFQAPKEFVF